MEVLFKICVGISIGVIIGFLLGGIKANFSKIKYSERQIAFTRKFVNKIANLLKYITIAVLTVGFVWCVYFLISAIVIPDQAEYADCMSELIVSVLTVISIIFAFVEFLRRAENKERD